MGLDPAVRKFLDTKPDSGDADEAITARRAVIRTGSDRLFDEFGAPVDPVEVEQDFVLPRPGGDIRVRVYRPAGAAGLPIHVFVLTLVAVTASLRPAAHGVRPLWSAPYAEDDTMTLTPTSLYVSHHALGSATLTAYDLATGRSRWPASSIDVVIQVPSVADGVVVAPDGYEKSSDKPDLILFRTTRTIARDAETGTVLWRASGAPQAVTDGSVLLTDVGGRGMAQVRKVRLHDGRLLWSHPAPGLAALVVVGHSVVTAAVLGRREPFRGPGRSWGVGSRRAQRRAAVDGCRSSNGSAHRCGLAAVQIQFSGGRTTNELSRRKAALPSDWSTHSSSPTWRRK